MAVDDNRYSRFVALARIVLPLLAVAILATLFLFARRSDPGEIPFAEIAEIARDQRISEARFTGVTADGAAVSLSADRITPVEAVADAFGLERLEAGIDAGAGGRISLSASSGLFDLRARRIDLPGLTRIETSAGYRMETAGLTADLGIGRVETRGPLEVRGPFGTFTAGRLVASPSGEGGAQRLLFDGGVRLVYQGGSDQGPP